MKPAAGVTILFLSIVCVLHLLRVLYGVGIVVGGRAVPIWPSVCACLATAALAGWLWREQRA